MSIKSLKYTQTTGAAAAVQVKDLIDASLISGANILPAVKCVVIQADTQALRYRDDGGTPTATVGHLLAVGKQLVVYRSQFATFKLIQAAATAVVNVTAYGENGPPFLPV